MFKQISVLPIDLATSAVTPAFATVLGEAAAVCLEKNDHISGVLLSANGISSETYKLEWDQLYPAHHSTYSDLQDATELGAYGIALLVVMDLTGKTVIERSAKGGGFDWWIGDIDPSGLPFQGKTRLEVSGILKDGGGSLAARVREKKKQIDPSNSLGPGIVAVVEFGQPQIRVEIP